MRYQSSKNRVLISVSFTIHEAPQKKKNIYNFFMISMSSVWKWSSIRNFYFSFSQIVFLDFVYKERFLRHWYVIHHFQTIFRECLAVFAVPHWFINNENISVKEKILKFKWFTWPDILNLENILNLSMYVLNKYLNTFQECSKYVLNLIILPSFSELSKNARVYRVVESSEMWLTTPFCWKTL